MAEDWGIIYNREIRESKDPLVKMADRIVYGCAIKREHLHEDEHYVKAVREATAMLREFLGPYKYIG